MINVNTIKEAVNAKCRKLVFAIKARLLRARPAPSVICNNCLGAFVLHDFGLPFNSPFVNLWIPPADYLCLLSDLKGLIDKEIIDITDRYADLGYPVGLLAGKITIHFMHYATFEQAVAKWHERSQRIDYDNLRVILVERDGTTLNELLAFDQIPYSRKVALTHQHYPQIKSAYPLPNCVEGDQLGHPHEYTGWLGRRHYDEYDFQSFFFD